ncbi:hypothetical protein FOA52_010445 [Chlamydomonas sp. UWO 241]|nr:hypothetical protein FOA52_006070 [Chlamydomonas sp. UWO 241]KAG1664026.1 hypothetical protein FOA52_010445 [Chlamydomonas sp. UWO 241]
MVSLFQTAYKIAAILLCTERGSVPRRALLVRQAWVGVAACLLINIMLEAQHAYGAVGFLPIDAALRTRVAVIAAMECGAPLLLLLLTPKVAPAGAGSCKAESASDEQLPAAAQTSADARVSAFSSSTSAAAHSHADTAVVRAAVPVGPPTAAASDGGQLQYTSILMTHSVPFAVKFPALHLADDPHLATPHGLAALRERLESKLSARASLRFGALVTLRFVELTVAAGCIVVHGRVRVEGCVVDEAEVEMIRVALASELLLELTPEGELVPDGDAAMMQLGPALDRCAAWRVYTTLIILATMGATSDYAIWAVSFKYDGDFLLIAGKAAFEQPRSPALGAAISLLVELPAMCAYRWYTLALCGQPVGLGQALFGFSIHTAVLAAGHVAVWWAGTRTGRATKVKVA